MSLFLYTLIIFPLEESIELSWLFVYKIFRDPAIAVLGVNAAVSVCTLPLYFIAEKHQQSERAIQKRLKPEIDNIKAVFSGDERYMILSTYYRQNHYHPVYALRSSFGLLIQLPIFIAAYSYLSNLGAIWGVFFLFIKDLGVPDAILSVTGGGGGQRVADPDDADQLRRRGGLYKGVARKRKNPDIWHGAGFSDFIVQFAGWSCPVLDDEQSLFPC
jgi:membrane protein insertase Oxa1/YidC/SpoIIIJ